MKVDFLTYEDFRDASTHAKSSILRGIVKGFPEVAKKYKVKPVHAALAFGQIGVESAHFKTMEEYASGDAYDTRTDLGNTPQRDGDGRLNKGAGLIQRTGHTNLAISAKRYGMTMPEIRKALKEDPVLAIDDAFHYCMIERGRQMAACVKQENIRILTKAVNGGYNHHNERVRYTRLFMLGILGYILDESGIRQFQSDSKDYTDTPDGRMGPKTETALWKAIKKATWEYPVGQTLTQKVTTNKTAVDTTVAVGASGGLVAVLYAAWQWFFGG